MTKIGVFPNRPALYSVLPQNAIGAELGVHHGDNALDLLQVAQPDRLHLIDTWPNPDMMEEVVQKFEDYSEVVIHQGQSQEIVKGFRAEYFDWIYIDADHRYPAVLADLLLYHPKVKKGGLVLGHDFANLRGAGMSVVRAVLECVAEGLYEFQYLTKQQFSSFGLKRI